PAGATGATGPAGATGATGPAGATGATGRPGKMLLVSCTTVTKTVKRNGHKLKVKSRKCTTKQVSGTTKFTTTTARAQLVRHQTLYATGSTNHRRLILHAHRTIRPGRYTLILTHRHGQEWFTTRRTIMIA
ncbi:MAG: collagen-like triple helix repeat-containing protein, partial [Solirubrobacteraceae bacterium]